MARRNRRFLPVLLAALCACAGQPESADNHAVCSAYSGGASHVEVIASGRVTRVLGVQSGRISPHEGFLMQLDSVCSLEVRVEANTDFTGQFPLARGDRTIVKGEYEYYARGGVIHWTHRDPRGRHIGGYIESGGKTYN